MKTKIVLFSGGLDSSVLLNYVRRQYPKARIIALNIFYGQRHAKEIQAAKRVFSQFSYPKEFIAVDLTQIFENITECSLLNKDMELPEGAYTGEATTTEVPFRNGIFLSVAASLASQYDADEIFIGVHSDEGGGSAYADTSEEFIDSASSFISHGTRGSVSVKAPFLYGDKAGVVRKGLMYHTPFELTWSCYAGGDVPCGECATCIDRKKAFAELGFKERFTSNEGYFLDDYLVEDTF